MSLPGIDKASNFYNLSVSNRQEEASFFGSKSSRSYGNRSLSKKGHLDDSLLTANGIRSKEPQTERSGMKKNKSIVNAQKKKKKSKKPVEILKDFVF